jgi:hypothetical protein
MQSATRPSGLFLGLGGSRLNSNVAPLAATLGVAHRKQSFSCSLKPNFEVEKTLWNMAITRLLSTVKKVPKRVFNLSIRIASLGFPWSAVNAILRKDSSRG